MRAEISGITPEEAMYELKKCETFRMVLEGLNSTLWSISMFADSFLGRTEISQPAKRALKEIKEKIGIFANGKREYLQLKQQFTSFINTSVGIPTSLKRAFPDDAVKEYNLSNQETLKVFRRLLEEQRVLGGNYKKLAEGLQADILNLKKELEGDKDIEKDLDTMAGSVARAKEIVGWLDSSGADFEKWFAQALTQATLGNIQNYAEFKDTKERAAIFYQITSTAGIETAQAEKTGLIFSGAAFENIGLIASYLVTSKDKKVAVAFGDEQEYLAKAIEKMNKYLPEDSKIIIIRQGSQALPAEIAGADNIVYFKTEQDGTTWLEDFARQKQLPLQVRVLSQAILQAMGSIKEISNDLNSFKIAIETLKKQS